MKLEEMSNKITAAVAVVIVGIGVLSYFLYWVSYNQAMPLMSNNMLVYALPTFEALEDKRFKELVDNQISNMLS